MRKTTILILFICTVHFFFTCTSYADTKTAFELLPDIALSIPENKAHRDYMGLQGEPGTPFTLSQIDADILIVELFSMYCSYCQNAAPVVNELYEKMEQVKRPDMKLVIIGIGASNTDIEVDTFRKGFDIAFPLFSDRDLSIYKTLKGAGTPTFIGSKKNGEGKNVIFFRKSAGFPDASVFLDDILNRSGLK